MDKWLHPRKTIVVISRWLPNLNRRKQCSVWGINKQLRPHNMRRIYSYMPMQLGHGMMYTYHGKLWDVKTYPYPNSDKKCKWRIPLTTEYPCYSYWHQSTTLGAIQRPPTVFITQSDQFDLLLLGLWRACKQFLLQRYTNISRNCVICIACFPQELNCENYFIWCFWTCQHERVYVTDLRTGWMWRKIMQIW